MAMKRKYRLVLFAILSLLVLCFIFGNSLQGGEASNAVSGGVSSWLKPILDPFDLISDVFFHILVRKLAHFTEFAALGFCLTGMVLNMNVTTKQRRYLPALWAFLAACTDETIQRFTGRTSAFKDVCIDFSGAVFGIMLVWVIVWLWRKGKR